MANFFEPKILTKEQVIASELDGREILSALAKFREKTADIDPNYLLFWSRGRTFSREREAPSSENKEVTIAFQEITSIQNNTPNDNVYHTVNSLLDPYNENKVLSGYYNEVTKTQMDLFWRTVSESWARLAQGKIGVAVRSSVAYTNFRMFEYPIIMENKNITEVFVLEGDIVNKGHHAIIPCATPDKVEILSYQELRTRFGYASHDLSSLTKEKTYHSLHVDIVPTLPPKTMPKEEWAEWQKQQWYNTSKRHLLNILNDKEESVYSYAEAGSHLNRERSSYILIDAEMRFLGEIAFSVRELERLESLARKTNDNDSLRLLELSIKKETGRLKDAMKVINDYPFIADVKAPLNDIEKEHGRLYAIDRWDRTLQKLVIKGWKSKINIFTQTLGNMFLGMDDSLTNAQKHSLWGIFENYDLYNLSNKPNTMLPDKHFYGNPEALEAYTEGKIKQLLEKALERTSKQNTLSETKMAR